MMNKKTIFLAGLFLLLGLSNSLLADFIWQSGPSFQTLGGRTGGVGINYNGTIMVLGGQPFRSKNDQVGKEKDRGAADYLLPGATSWQKSREFDSSFSGLGAGVDSLGRLVVYGGSAGINFASNLARVYDMTYGVETGYTVANKNYAAANSAFAQDNQGRLYSIGGGSGNLASTNNPNSNLVERYNALTNSWEILAQLPEARSHASAVYDGQGHILVTGGFNTFGSSRQSTVFSYDIGSDSWSSIASLPEALTGQRSILGIDGLVYALGGVSGNPSGGTIRDSVFVFDPSSKQWTTGPSMITARHSFAIALSDDGFIYAIGGSIIGGGTNSVEMLNTVPEPVTISLLALGSITLLLKRKTKHAKIL